MPQISKRPFFTLPDGHQASEYTLHNSNGMSATFCDYGAGITSFILPDKDNIPRDVTLGFHTPSDYIENRHHFSAIIGRYANRICRGRFNLNGQEYQIPVNNLFGHAQHGGPIGFHQALWNTEVDGNTLIFFHVSPDGDQGFPGNLSVKVSYSLTDLNELRMEYRASSDKTTVLNLTNHVYFNLTGCQDNLINNHEVFINATDYVEVDHEGIPTGKILPVDNTPLDLRYPHELRPIMKSNHPLITATDGFDQNYVLDSECKSLLTPAATVFSRDSGILLEMFTTEPAVGFYTGNFLGSKLPGKGGLPYRKHSGLCLEAQHYPDAVNHPEFPTTVLNPDEEYAQTTIYRFTIVEQMPTR